MKLKNFDLLNFARILSKNAHIELNATYAFALAITRRSLDKHIAPLIKSEQIIRDKVQKTNEKLKDDPQKARKVVDELQREWEEILNKEIEIDESTPGFSSAAIESFLITPQEATFLLEFPLLYINTNNNNIEAQK